MEEIQVEDEDTPFWETEEQPECFGMGEAWALLGLAAGLKVKEEVEDNGTEPPSPVMDALRAPTSDNEDPLWTAVQKEVIVKTEKLAEKVSASNLKFLG